MFSCFGSPTLNIQNHGTVSVGGQLLLGEIGAIRSDGTGNLAGNVKYAGTISPGNLPGARIDGNLTNNVGNFQNGKLQFALACTTSFAKLEVTGNVSLFFGGMLEVIRLGGHNPTAGQSYDLLDWGGSLTGTFSTIQLPPLAAGLDWNTSQLYITGSSRSSVRHFPATTTITASSMRPTTCYGAMAVPCRTKSIHPVLSTRPITPRGVPASVIRAVARAPT